VGASLEMALLGGWFWFVGFFVVLGVESKKWAYALAQALKLSGSAS